LLGAAGTNLISFISFVSKVTLEPSFLLIVLFYQKS